MNDKVLNNNALYISLISLVRVWMFIPAGVGVLPHKGLAGTCGPLGYGSQDFCLEQGINFSPFCLKQGVFT